MKVFNLFFFWAIFSIGFPTSNAEMLDLSGRIKSKQQLTQFSLELISFIEDEKISFWGSEKVIIQVQDNSDKYRWASYRLEKSSYKVILITLYYNDIFDAELRKIDVLHLISHEIAHSRNFFLSNMSSYIKTSEIDADLFSIGVFSKLLPFLDQNQLKEFSIETSDPFIKKWCREVSKDEHCVATFKSLLESTNKFQSFKGRPELSLSEYSKDFGPQFKGGYFSAQCRLDVKKHATICQYKPRHSLCKRMRFAPPCAKGYLNNRSM